MSIYSTNRMGNMSVATAVANENYSGNDIGQILYESQVNDQAFFEAIVLSDLKEINGIREGTLLESEVRAYNEANISAFFEKLKKRLKEFWEKVKGVFKDVTTKIAIFITKDAKKFLKDFEKGYDKSKYKEDVYTNASRIPISTHFVIPNVQQIEKRIENDKTERYIDKTAILHEELAKSLHGCKEKYLTPKDFKIEAKRLVFAPQPVPVDYEDIDILKKNISSAKNTIETLAKNKNDIEKGIKELEARLKNAEKESGSKTNVSNISALISVYENLTSVVMNTVIACVKYNIRKSYSTLNAILHKCIGSSSVTTESAVILAEDAVDEVLDGEIQELDKDTKEAVDTIVDAAEEDI